VRPPGATESKGGGEVGGKIYNLDEINFKLLSFVKSSSINDCDLFNPLNAELNPICQ